jgi:hypothetical protein
MMNWIANVSFMLPFLYPDKRINIDGVVGVLGWPDPLNQLPGQQSWPGLAQNFNFDRISEITGFGSHHHHQLVSENYNQVGFG